MSLAVGAAGGCADDGPETVDAYLLGACVRSSPDAGLGTPVQIEYRLDGEAVATGETEVGQVFVAEVPLGTVDACSDGDYLGSGETDRPSVTDEDGRPVGGVYLGGEGCPVSPS